MRPVAYFLTHWACFAAGAYLVYPMPGLHQAALFCVVVVYGACNFSMGASS